MGITVFWITCVSALETTFQRATELQQSCFGAQLLHKEHAPSAWKQKCLWATAATQDPPRASLVSKKVFGAVVLNFRGKCRPNAEIFSPGNPQLQFWNLDSHICLISFLWSILALSTYFSVKLVKVQQVSCCENRALIKRCSQVTFSTYESHCRLLKDYNKNCSSPCAGMRKHDATNAFQTARLHALKKKNKKNKPKNQQTWANPFLLIYIWGFKNTIQHSH